MIMIMKNNYLLKIALVFIFLLFLLLMSCSKNENKEYNLNPKTPVKIIVWNYYNGSQKTYFDKLVKDFNKTLGREKGIIIEVFSQGSIDNLIDMLRKNVLNGVDSDEMPNLITSYTDLAKELDDMGLLSSFDEYFSEKELSAFIESFIEEGRFDKDKSLKIIPVIKSTEVLILNKTYWDKFSEATGENIAKLSTWEGIAEVSKKYYDYSDGKAFFGRDAMANYMLVASYQLGHEIFSIENEELSIDIDKESMKKIWDNFYIPYVSGHYYKYGKYASDDVKTGDIIAYVASTSGSLYFPNYVVLEDDTEYQIEMLVLPLPNFKDTKKVAVQQGAGFIMTKSTKLKEYAASIFLKWLTEDQRNLEFAYNMSYMPVKSDMIKNDVLSEYIDNKNKKNVEYESNILQTLEVSIKQFQEYELYASKVIKNSIQVRRYLENTLLERAIEDKKKIEMTLGIDGKPATIKKSVINDSKNFIIAYSDKSFELWYNEMQSSLSYLILGK